MCMRPSVPAVYQIVSAQGLDAKPDSQRYERDLQDSENPSRRLGCPAGA